MVRSIYLPTEGTRMADVHVECRLSEGHNSMKERQICKQFPCPTLASYVYNLDYILRYFVSLFPGDYQVAQKKSKIKPLKSENGSKRL